ncbi:hypothetical protein [Streptomyces aidingensis]|uniref:Alpha/beta hydrolase family protein n=1 Tax=Streptomyces aidingensis TaxID=910347 RepID=A0A1I1EKY0_9ACTN|nr:hypothetical protein [Streptomyces aidingensis]SFB87282.1 hypothetical protein SAMN05421773_101335 [Streptomyces aidingensis]
MDPLRSPRGARQAKSGSAPVSAAEPGPPSPLSALSRLWPLALLAAVVPGLALAGVLPRWPGLVHAVALPPAGFFTDLRVLLARSSSYPVFLALLALVLAIRVAVLCVLLGGVRGITPRRAAFALLFHLAAGVPLMLAAQLEFIAQTLLYARLFWTAVALLALSWFLTAPLPWQSTTRLRTAWRRSWRQGLRISVLLPYALVLLAIGALADARPALVLWLVPVSALATAVAVTALSRPPRGRPLRRLAAAGCAFAVLATVFVSTRADPGHGPSPPPRAGSLLLMSGIGSHSGRGAIFETEVGRLGYTCEQTYYFSYAGPGEGQPQRSARCPITTGRPYGPADTQRPLQEQVTAFAEQVRGLPEPVMVIAHSHAVWVVWQALAEGVAPGVDTLVLVGPFPASPLGYPPPGERGEGRVAGDLLRLIVPLAGILDFQFRADAPAARQLLADAGASSRIISRPLPPGVRTLSVTSATDLPLMPDGWRLPVDRNVCPQRVAHPYLPIRPAFYHEVNRFLAGRPPLPCPPWRDWGAYLARPWGVPPADS